MRRWLCVPLVFVASIASGAPLGIQVLSAQYTTDLSTRVRTMVSTGDHTFEVITREQSRTETQGDPRTDHLQGSTFVFGAATADRFSVAAETSAFFDLALNEVSTFATALSETVLHFAPLQDQHTVIGLDVVGANQVWHSTGFASLFDVTTDQLLWRYGWDRFALNESTIPWTLAFDAAALTVGQDFLASHRYALTMHVATDANTDQQFVTMRAAGLYAVPEPSSLVLLVVGITAAMVRRRRSEP